MVPNACTFCVYIRSNYPIILNWLTTYIVKYRRYTYDYKL